MKITRRELLQAGAAAGLAGALGCSAPEPAAPPAPWRPTVTPKLPAVYISHGSPMTALKTDEYTRALGTFGASVAPSAIVIVSAHWLESPPVQVTTAAKPETIYDFYNFPDELYKVTYASPGHPSLAHHVVALLRDSGLHTEANDSRGLDHGAWVPMKHSYPSATTPVIQVSLPALMEPSDLADLGRMLAPLRTQGVLLVGSGGLVHNLRAMRGSTKGVDGWARAFEDWVMKRVEAIDVKALLDYRSKAPNAEMAAPTTEHFDPIFVVLGAAAAGDKVTQVFEGYQGSNMSMRCFALA
jgi:4,5-DOPA dioxygenase extradiol